MKRREKFILAGNGMNCSLWLYQAKFSRPDLAKKVFETLIRKRAILNSEDDIYYPESYLSNPEKGAA